MTPTKTDVRPARSPASAKKTMQLPRSPWLTLLLLLAVGVIVYGYVNDRRAKQMQAELMEEVSQSAAADEAAAESVAE